MTTNKDDLLAQVRRQQEIIVFEFMKTMKLLIETQKDTLECLEGMCRQLDEGRR